MVTEPLKKPSFTRALDNNLTSILNKISCPFGRLILFKTLTRLSLYDKGEGICLIAIIKYDI
jgi:hypothetical protein